MCVYVESTADGLHIVECQTFEEAKDRFEKFLPEYRQILETVRLTCDGHSLCEDENLDYAHEALSVFIEALIVEDSQLYKAGTEMLYQLEVFPAKRMDCNEE